MLGALSFAAPWALGALALLPAVWWLLRVVPPSPRRQDFPAIRLLRGLASSQQTAARTPPWLVALRLFLATLVIAAVAHPIIDAQPSGVDGPLLVVVDNGWSAAKAWPVRRAALDQLLDQAGRDGRPVALLATAPPIDGGPVAASGLMPPSQAKSLAGAMEPRPWNVDRKAAEKALAGLPNLPALRAVWLADGLGDDAADAFGQFLARLGTLQVMVPPPGGSAKLLMPPEAGAGDPAPTVRRLAQGQAETVAVRAVDQAGRTLIRRSVDLAGGQGEAPVPMAMPTELRNRVARFEIEGEEGAGAVALLDDRFKRRPVGLVDRGGSGASPLLDDLYYAERALAPIAEVRKAPVTDLLNRQLSMIVLPDSGGLADDERAALGHWVEGGGVLVRLGGPKMARNPDALLPVRLLGGGRTLGGAMSWTQPMTVAPMGESGPFAGLKVPPDLKIKAQVLAEPAIDLNDKTWARLSDGTPLVTGAALGKGWVVLIHTTVWPEWSNLGLSGLFPDMLERLLALGQGYAEASSDKPLPPLLLLDGFGHLAPPAGIVESLMPKDPAPVPGPRHPPGYYGRDQGRTAFNLAPAILPLQALEVPAGATRSVLGERPSERDLQPALLIAALGLLLADMGAVLWLKGVRLGMTAAVILVGLAALSPSPSRAAPPLSADKAEQAALSARLAYVVTGDGAVDEVSRAGLDGLSAVLARRTTAVLGEPDGVDVERDSLTVYPLLYWPVTARQGALSAQARERTNDFLRHGGMILFDTRDRGEGGPDALLRLTQGLDIPPLTPVTEAHVLTHSFYLLRDLPGRWTGAGVYVQDGGDPANDDVSPVVIGGNDWAAAWAVDANGNAMFAAVPGGEQQRETAYRFGVNLVMYALTGSYKADQVHLPAILERMKR